jgi:hypothetical protein
METPPAIIPQMPALTPQQAAGVQVIIARTCQMIAESQGWGRNCLSCAHFTEASEHCAQWNRRPPARFIVLGCERWKGGEPF